MSEVLSSVLSFEPKPPDVTGSRSNGWQTCAASQPGAPSAADHQIGSIYLKPSRESRIISGKQALKTG